VVTAWHLLVVFSGLSVGYSAGHLGANSTTCSPTISSSNKLSWLLYSLPHLEHGRGSDPPNPSGVGNGDLAQATAKI
jgi:hypothetical protein